MHLACVLKCYLKKEWKEKKKRTVMKGLIYHLTGEEGRFDDATDIAQNPLGID